ncbi:Transmembrane and TPR repeat-containing protein [Hypsibius exemplaris]|uniref:dolichyl-phosphate-mannose--protein mannosyltransferase n=1 Tax=Hypsibius exemplaris TaxID=2072580 RepID=A0A1W0WUV3_HYPEX|nr:Transmembrane and TPR repeat-containing protein [Hypsibius exemplaris]
MDSSESDESDGSVPIAHVTVGRRHNSTAAAAPRQWIYYAGALVVLSLACFSNVGDCELVFDDISAIKENKDLRPTQPLWNLLFNDFWGTPMSKENSHKSYRPFTVLTFRWNYALHGLDPFGYHVTNVVLHAINSALVFRLYTIFVPRSGAFVGALLFAVQPIHSEAVTGVVGRCEMLSTMFAILLFLIGTSATVKVWTRNVTMPFLLFLALFSKEQGITITAICAVYEIFCRQQLMWSDVMIGIRDLVREKPKLHPAFGRAAGRLWALGAATIVLLLWRLRIMKGQLPVFTAFDNPASTSTFPTKHLTYIYLLPLNLWLLIFPNPLLCDYTMGAVPLVKSFADPRNLATVLFAFAVAKLSVRALNSKCLEDRCALLMSLSWIVFPFLPASNLFFPVGFVVAERILYMPSVGFCLLVAYGYPRVIRLVTSRQVGLKYIGTLSVTIAVLAFGLRTYVRNGDWKSEHTLFRSGLKVTQANAKIWNNIGHALEKDKNLSAALVFFTSATTAQPDDIGAWNNVGRTLNALNRSVEAEAAFRTAKALLPQPKPGQKYQTRIAPAHLNVFLNLGAIMARDPARLEEADQILRQAISLRSDYVDAYINRGDVLLKMNRTDEAVAVYKKALEFNAENPDVFYNLAIVYLERQDPNTALEFFNKALSVKPDHQLALLNSAVLMGEMKKLEYHGTIEQRLKDVLKMEQNPNAYFQMGLLMMDRSDPVGAEQFFRKTIELKEDHKSALFNIALLLNNRKKQDEALPFLLRLVHDNEDHIKGWILLGDIYINQMKNYTAAEAAYRQVLIVEPDNFQALHNYCVTLVEQNKFAAAETCMGDLAEKMKDDRGYLTTHFKTIFDRLHRRKLIHENDGTVPVFK